MSNHMSNHTNDIKFLMDFFQSNKANLAIRPEDVPRFREIAAKLAVKP